MEPLEELLSGLDYSDEQRKTDEAEGRARFGGVWAQPDYPSAYLEAARILVQQAKATGRLNALAIVCLYTQRHALELLLKALLLMLHEISDDEERLAVLERREARAKSEEEARSRGTTAPPEEMPQPSSTRASTEERRLATGGHSLSELLAALTAAYQRSLASGASWCPLPADLAPLVGEFEAIEMSRETRFRYPKVRSKTKGREEQSFARVVVAPVEAFQSRLDALNAELYAETEGHPATGLAAELAFHSIALDQNLYYAGFNEADRPVELP